MSRKTFPAPLLSDSGTSGPAASTTMPPLPLSRKRRRGLTALGLLLVASGGLLTHQVVAQISDRSPIVVASRDIPIGQRIGPADVTTARVGADSGVAAIPGHQLSQVVGSVAAVDLRRGTVIPPGAVSDQLSPVPGQQLVPIAVKPSRLPARGLQPGDLLVVVSTPEGASDKAPEAKLPAPGQISAVVDRVTGSPDTDGLLVVDLLVSATDGPQLARQAADGHVTFTLTSRRP